MIHLSRRFYYTLIVLFLASVASFAIIELPPGDFLDIYAARLEMLGDRMSQEELDGLRQQYGLDQPMFVRYGKWIWGMLQGRLGMAMDFESAPVAALLGPRLGLTAVLSFFSIIFTYLIALPIGIYSATRQYSLGDYLATTVGFIGLATPNFLLALILMFFFARYFGFSVGGLFSPEYANAPWTWAKVVDMLPHLPLPIVVIGTSAAAAIIRVMRGTLLDELSKQYVITARAKGLGETRLLVKYPVRIALNPIISTIGWVLPQIVSGSIITAVVLNLPTTGPLLLDALKNQDVYLAGSIVMLLSAVTVLGTFFSDVLLAWSDPRIRFEKKGVD